MFENVHLNKQDSCMFFEQTISNRESDFICSKRLYETEEF